MKLHYCDHCDTCLSNNEVVEVKDSEPYEFWGERGVRHIVSFECPNCGSELGDPVVVCERCHDALPSDGSDYCPPCESAIDVELEAAEHKHQLRGTLLDIMNAARGVC